MEIKVSFILRYILCISTLSPYRLVLNLWYLHGTMPIQLLVSMIGCIMDPQIDTQRPLFYWIIKMKILMNKLFFHQMFMHFLWDSVMWVSTLWNSYIFNLKNSSFSKLKLQIPAQSTYYFCDIFALPAFTKPVHFIQYEMVVNPIYKKNVHHLLVYECDDDYVLTAPLARECGRRGLPAMTGRKCMQKMVC